MGYDDQYTEYLGYMLGYRPMKNGERLETPKPLRIPTHRSRLTNGRALLPGIDRRSSWSRRFYDLTVSYTNDLGGESEVSTGEAAIIRRVVCIQVEAELLEHKFALAETGALPSDLDLYARLSNSLNRLLSTVGLRRRPRDVTPDLHSYINGHAVEAETVET